MGKSEKKISRKFWKYLYIMDIKTFKNILEFIGTKNVSYKLVKDNPKIIDGFFNSMESLAYFNLFKDYITLDNRRLNSVLLSTYSEAGYKTFKKLLDDGHINFEIDVSNLITIVNDVHKEKRVDLLRFLIKGKHIIKNSNIINVIKVIPVIKDKRDVIELFVEEYPEIFEDFGVDHLVNIYNNFKWIKEYEMNDIYDILFRSEEFIQRVKDSDGLLYNMFKFTESIEWLYNRLSSLGFKNIFDGLMKDSFYQELLKGDKMVEIKKIIDRENG